MVLLWDETNREQLGGFHLLVYHEYIYSHPSHLNTSRSFFSHASPPTACQSASLVYHAIAAAVFRRSSVSHPSSVPIPLALGSLCTPCVSGYTSIAPLSDFVPLSLPRDHVLYEVLLVFTAGIDRWTLLCLLLLGAAHHQPGTAEHGAESGHCELCISMLVLCISHPVSLAPRCG